MEEKVFKRKIVYQIYPRSFCDSNDDGIGDLKGIISKLDYLKDLGIGIIWLSPIYDSPLDDMGYDVKNYFEILKDYGTMDDFDNLVSEAKKRDIRIVMDLVVNHTSDEAMYFQEALKDPNSKYRDWYYFRKGKGKNNQLPPNNWDSIFTGSAWERLKNEPNTYYLHLYGKKQPDLNWHNEEVVLEVEKILKFWLDKGIYGFRCDVIDQIYKESLEDGKHRSLNTGLEHYLCTKGNHDILKRLRKDVFSKYDCVVIGENAFMSFEMGKDFMAGDELDMFFQFDGMNVDKRKIPVFGKKFKPQNLRKTFFDWEEEVPWNAIYLENHDQLRSINRFGDPKHFYKESGKALATILLTLKGTAFIYNGEEIGMLNYDHINKEDINDVSVKNVYEILKGIPLPNCIKDAFAFRINRDNCRSPMAWNNSKNAGFCNKGQPWLKVNEKYKLGINVSDNLLDSNSILNYYKTLIKFRNESKVLQLGSFKALKSSKNVFAFERELENEKLLIIVNLSKKSIKNEFLEIKKDLVLSNYLNTDEPKRLKPYFAAIYKINNTKNKNNQ